MWFICSLERTDVRLFDPPHVPHKQASIWTKRRRHIDHLFLRHVLPFIAAALGLELRDVPARESSHATLNPEVSSTKDVHTLQPEAREHLDAPAAQPAHGDELLEHLLVGGVGEPARGELPVGELGRQALDVLGLALRQPRGPEALDAGGGDLGRRGELVGRGGGRGVGGGRVVEEVDEAGLDGLCRRARDLLGDYARGEGLEGVDFLGEPARREDSAVVGCYQGLDAGVDCVKAVSPSASAGLHRDRSAVDRPALPRVQIWGVMWNLDRRNSRPGPNAKHAPPGDSDSRERPTFDEMRTRLVKNVRRCRWVIGDNPGRLWGEQRRIGQVLVCQLRYSPRLWFWRHGG